MKKLSIDWGELSLAFDNSFWGASYYLDTETGQVLTVTDEANQQLEQIYETQDSRRHSHGPHRLADDR